MTIAYTTSAGKVVYPSGLFANHLWGQPQFRSIPSQKLANSAAHRANSGPDWQAICAIIGRSEGQVVKSEARACSE